MKRNIYIERQHSFKMLLMLTAFIAAAVIIIIQTDKFIRPVLESVCEEECRSFASRLIGESIEKTLSENPYDYNDFADLLRDEKGNVTAVETLTGNVNRLQAKLLLDLNDILDKSRNAEISVSLGTASGVWLLAGRGPSVPMRFLPIGSAGVELVSTFESAGINQTCHKILIEVSVHAAGAVPFCKTETDIKYEYLLAETIIMGDVPEGYAAIDKKY